MLTQHIKSSIFTKFDKPEVLKEIACSWIDGKSFSDLQLYLNKRHLTDLANKTIDTLREEQKLGKDSVVVYKGKKFAVLDFDFYTEIIADLPEEGRRRIKERIHQLRTFFNQRGPSDESLKE